MAKKGKDARRNVFEKRRLTPDQFRSVARMRVGDAQSLIDTGVRERMNGAVYMAGFAIECLLKALLLERHPNLATPVDTADLSPSDRRVHNLLYRLHELDEMLDLLPEIEKKLRASEGRVAGAPSWSSFQALCAQWAVYVRYSPQTIPTTTATEFVSTVNTVRPVMETL